MNGASAWPPDPTGKGIGKNRTQGQVRGRDRTRAEQGLSVRAGHWLLPLLVAALIALMLLSAVLVAARNNPRLTSEDLMNLLLVREIVDRQGDFYWHGTSNPFLVPEPLFEAMGDALFEEVGLVHLVAYGTQVLMILAGLVVLAKCLRPEARWSRLLGASALGSCLYGLAVLGLPDLGRWSYKPATHGAHWPLAIVTIALVCSALGGGRGSKLRSTLGAAVCLSLLTFSDRVFLLWITVPCLSLVLFVLMVERGSRPPSVLRGLALVASVPASVILAGTVRASGRIDFGSETYEANLSGPMWSSWTRFVADLRDSRDLALGCVVGALFLLMAVFSLGRRARLWPKGEEDPAVGERRRVLFSLLCASALAVVPTVTVAGGFWLDRHAGRFLQPLFVMPVLWLAVWSISGSPRWTRRFSASASVIVVLGSALIAHASAPIEELRLAAGAVDDVAELEVLAGKLGLQGGLSDYWFAGTIRAISRGRVRVAPVEWNTGAPMLWGGSPDWHFDAPDVDFLIIDRLDPVMTTAKFGHPDCVARAGPYTLWIYGKDSSRLGQEYRREALERARAAGFHPRTEWFDRATPIPIQLPAGPERDSGQSGVPCASLDHKAIFEEDFESGSFSRWISRVGRQ